MASETLTFEGVVERVQVESQKPFDPYIGRYSPMSEYLDFCLNVSLRLDDGEIVYFRTPPVQRVVASCPGAAIVHYSGFEKEGGKWLREVGENKVAVPGQSNDNHLEPLVRVGDRIKINARVKAEKVSRSGNKYRTLNWIRRQS